MNNHKEPENKEKKRKDIDRQLEKSSTSEENTAKKHDQILKQQLEEGQEIYERSIISILLSSVTAGLEIGFSYLLLCSVFTFFTGKLQEETVFKLLTFVYPVGFIMVILGKSILFTEQTSLLSLPVLNNERSLWSLLKMWGLVIMGNLFGGWLMALLLIWIGPALGVFDRSAVVTIADHVTGYSPLVIFVSGILAGWLMGLLSWLLTSAKDTVSRLLIIYMITAVMSFTGLHHSIIGNVEVFGGLITSASIDIFDYLSFEGFALLGNAIGGAVFVALLKYRAFVYNVTEPGSKI
ncbi:MAG: formate/nitrite transporter family protein [Salegentibacter sp.]